MTESIETSVASHYARNDLTETILNALQKTGANVDKLSPSDLAPVDEFHTAGKAATTKALAMMSLGAQAHILDVGCGIGGTSRTIATEHGCRVTGIDLTPEFIQTAMDLTARTDLSDTCTFQTASALDMPFENASFDGAVTMHVAMNIQDRTSLYKEVSRVLKPGAEFCVFDVMKGPTPGMSYPVPWAETEETSFLKSRDETAALLEDAGFIVRAEENLLEFAIEFFEANAKRAAEGGPPHLGLHVIMGDSAPAKFANYLTAAKAHQIEPVILICQKTRS